MPVVPCAGEGVGADSGPLTPEASLWIEDREWVGEVRAPPRGRPADRLIEGAVERIGLAGCRDVVVPDPDDDDDGLGSCASEPLEDRAQARRDLLHRLRRSCACTREAPLATIGEGLRI